MNNNYNKILHALPFILLVLFCAVSFSYLRITESINPDYYAEVVAIESEYRGTVVVSTKLQYNPKVKVVTEGKYKDQIFQIADESDLFLNVGVVIPISIHNMNVKYLIKREKAYFYLMVLLLTLVVSSLKIIKIYKRPN